mgnify:CR=1 FL=1
MVSKESATGGRHQSAPSFVIHIDENHSNMVKFKEGDILIPILADKIREISQFKGPGLSDTASPGQALHQTDDDGVNASFQTLDMRAGSAQDLSDKYKRVNEGRAPHLFRSIMFSLTSRVYSCITICPTS